MKRKHYGPHKGNWWSYEKAKLWIRKKSKKYDIHSEPTWKAYCKKYKVPKGMPLAPKKVYGAEYISDTDFFGYKKRQWLTYEQAKQWVREVSKTHDISSDTKWRAFLRKHKKPKNIPSSPRAVYGAEYISDTDFFGYTPIEKYVSYEKAKIWMHKISKQYGVDSYTKWRKFINEYDVPSYIPTSPRAAYGKDYISDADYFGKPERAWLTYAAAKKYLAKFKITSRPKFNKWYKEKGPKFIPRQPSEFYGDDWVSWPDFLSKGKFYKDVPYDEAIKWVHKQKIKTSTEWRVWCREKRIPQGIPVNPDAHYSEWVSWPTWLGKNASSKVSAQEKNTSILFILHEAGMPSNVYTIGIEKDGIKALELWQDFDKFQIYKLYKFEIGLGETLNQILTNNCTQWWESDSDNQYLVQNIYSLENDLQRVFDPILLNKSNR